MLLAISILIASIGANEALKDKPCHKVLIAQERTAEGTIETRTCKD